MLTPPSQHHEMIRTREAIRLTCSQTAVSGQGSLKSSRCRAQQRGFVPSRTRGPLIRGAAERQDGAAHRRLGPSPRRPRGALPASPSTRLSPVQHARFRRPMFSIRFAGWPWFRRLRAFAGCGPLRRRRQRHMQLPTRSAGVAQFERISVSPTRRVAQSQYTAACRFGGRLVTCMCRSTSLSTWSPSPPLRPVPPPSLASCTA